MSSGISCSTVKARKRFPLANRNTEPKQNKHLVISVSASREHVLLWGVEGKAQKISLYHHGLNAFTRVDLQNNWTNLNTLRICTRVSRGVRINSQ